MLGQVLVIALLAPAGNATIDAVYPCPVTNGDVGEFVVVDMPDNGPGGNLVLTDGEDTVDLSGIEASGKIVVAGNTTVARTLFDLPTYAVETPLSLRNGGERVSLQRGGQTIDSMRYPAGPEGELYWDGKWIRPGRSAVDPLVATDVPVTTFGLPDTPSPFRERIQTARKRVLVGGYTFTDTAVAGELIDAHRRGVAVTVLLEGGPVGGIRTAEVRAIERLRSAGIDVPLMGTDRARYDYHHAKYAVVDDTLLVSSENWKPGGTGGHGSRGWAIELDDAALAGEMAAVFRADATWEDVQEWPAARPAEPEPAWPDNGTYPTRFDERDYRATKATVILAPDNAEGAVKSHLRSGEESIWVQQVSIQSDGVLLNETIEAARRGVRVRVLVSGAWFVADENRALVSRLRTLSEWEGLPIAARVAEPRSRFEYAHNKGFIVDGESVLVGSLNWNAHAFHSNREVAVLVDDHEVATYYARLYRADWRGAAWRIPWGLVGIVTIALALGLVAARYFATFDAGNAVVTGDRDANSHWDGGRRLP